MVSNWLKSELLYSIDEYLNCNTSNLNFNFIYLFTVYTMVFFIRILFLKYSLYCVHFLISSLVTLSKLDLFAVSPFLAENQTFTEEY